MRLRVRWNMGESLAGMGVMFGLGSLAETKVGDDQAGEVLDRRNAEGIVVVVGVAAAIRNEGVGTDKAAAGEVVGADAVCRQGGMVRCCKD